MVASLVVGVLTSGLMIDEVDTGSLVGKVLGFLSVGLRSSFVTGSK